MELVLEDPVKLRLPKGLPEDLLDWLYRDLTVTDTSAKFQLARWKNSRPWKERQIGAEAYRLEEQRLLARMSRCLIEEDEKGLWVYSGVRDLVSRILSLPIRQAFPTPEARPLPWHRTPQQLFGRAPFDHQVIGSEALVAARHGAGSYATGSGKSLLIAMYLRSLGLRSVVVVYSGSIARQLFATLTALLGTKNVGMFDGKTKQLGKLITVATALSLKNVEPGTPGWEHFFNADVFVGDESHAFAADVLLGVSKGIMRNARYRAFVSATLLRSDGLDRVLHAVIGPTVAELTFRQAVERDILAVPHFGMVNVRSKVVCAGRDPDRLNRAHLYEGDDVLASAAAIGSKFRSCGYQVLYLVEEFPQAAKLLALVPNALVLHGNTGNRSVLPSTAQECDTELVRTTFNSSDVDLISTSAGRVGIDLTPERPMAVLYLVGGTSQVAQIQAIGRGARRRGKDHFYFFDFRVCNVPVLDAQADKRAHVSEQLYERPTEVETKHITEPS